MKKGFKLFISAVLVLSLLMSMAAFTSSAEEYNAAELRKSSVYVGSTIKFEASNSGIAFTISGTGTGFAIGEVGKPVEYIATCKHVVTKDSGIYHLYIDADTNEPVAYKEGVEGTKVPKQTYDSSTNCYIYTDYFKTSTMELRAIYSESTGDYAVMNIIGFSDSDVAICKLASDPTDKLTAFPLKRYNKTEVGEEVYAIGYPGISMYFNDEGKYDYSDSTVSDGIIQKKQLTTGLSGKTKQFNTYQISADISTGNSGGPLFTKDGAIIGINSFIVADSEQAISAKYSVCIDELIELLDTKKINYTLWTENAVPEEAPTAPAGASASNTERSNGFGIDMDTNMLIAIAAGCIAVIALIIIIIVSSSKRNKKNNAAAVQSNVNVQMPVTAPVVNTNPVKNYYLIGLNGYFAGRKFAVGDKVVIGRDSSRCNVAYPVDQPGISGIHCQIIREGSSLKLMDCNSTYGTYTADGRKIEANVVVMLQEGSKFYLGNKDNTFEVRS